MAILKNNDEKENTQGGQAPSPFLPNTSMPSNQTQAYTAPKKPANNSGRFTNIQSYLSAANSETGQQSGGQQIQAGVQKAQEQNAANVREGIAKSQEQFGNAYNAENTRLAGAQPFVQNTLQQVQTNPSQLTDEQINQYRGLATGQGAYKDLNGLSNAPDASGLQSAATMAGTEGGRYQLLNDTFKRPTYTSGQQKLDQLLLQTQSAAPLQRNLSQLATDVTGERTAAMTDADLKAKALHTLAGDVSTAANTGVAGAETSLENAVNDRVTSSQGSADKAYDYFNKALSGQTLKPEESAMALQFAKDQGIDLNQGLYGIPGYQDFHPEQFLTHQQFNKQNISSPEERARANALSKLAGSSESFLPGEASKDTPSLGNVFNKGSFGEASNKRKTEFESQYNPKKQKYDALQEVRDAWSDPNVSTLRNAIYKNANNLDPELVQRLLATKELSGGNGPADPALPVPNLSNLQPNMGGGMKAEKDYLGGIMQNMLDPQRNQLYDETQKLYKEYTPDQTLETLLKNGYRK